jgi:hypothetical protein
MAWRANLQRHWGHTGITSRSIEHAPHALWRTFSHSLQRKGKSRVYGANAPHREPGSQSARGNQVAGVLESVAPSSSKENNILIGRIAPDNMPAWLAEAWDILNNPAGVDFMRMRLITSDLAFVTWSRHYPDTKKGLEALTCIAKASKRFALADQVKMLALLANAAAKHRVVRLALKRPKGRLLTAMMDLLVSIAGSTETYQRVECLTQLSKAQEQLQWWSPVFWDTLQGGPLVRLDGRAVVSCVRCAAACFVDAGNTPPDGLCHAFCEASVRVAPTLAPSSAAKLCSAWVHLCPIWPMPEQLRLALMNAVLRVAPQMIAEDAAHVMHALAALNEPLPADVQAVLLETAVRVATAVPAGHATPLLEGLVELQVPLVGLLADSVFSGLRSALPVMPDAHVPRLAAALAALDVVLEEEPDIEMALRTAVLRTLPTLTAHEIVMLWRAAPQLGRGLQAAVVSNTSTKAASLLRAAADKGGVGPLWEQLVDRVRRDAAEMSPTQVAKSLVACAELGILGRSDGELVPVSELEEALLRTASDMALTDVCGVVRALTVQSDAGLADALHKPFERAIMLRLKRCEARHLIDVLGVLETLGAHVEGDLQGLVLSCCRQHLQYLQGSHACALVMGIARLKLPLAIKLRGDLPRIVATATERVNGSGLVMFVEALVSVGVSEINRQALHSTLAALAPSLARVSTHLTASEFVRLLTALQILQKGKEVSAMLHDSILSAASQLAPCMQQDDLRTVYSLLSALRVIQQAQHGRT